MCEIVKYLKECEGMLENLRETGTFEKNLTESEGTCENLSEF